MPTESERQLLEELTEERRRRAEAERRLEESEMVAHVGSFAWDVQQNRVSWTDELHRIYGLDPGQFGGTFEAFLGMVYPPELEVTRKTVFDAHQAQQPFVYDHRIVRADGSVRVLHTRGDVIKNAQGEPVRMVGACWDITELHDANEARERSLSLLSAALEATADAILVLSLDDKVVAYNQRLLDLWRTTKEVLEPSTAQDRLEHALRMVENPEAFRKRFQERLSQPEGDRVEIIRFKDGRVLESMARPQRIAGKVVGRVWSYRDVSDRERQLARALFLSDATRLLASLDVESALEAVARLVSPAMGDGCAIDLLGRAGPRRFAATRAGAVGLLPPEPHSLALQAQAVQYAWKDVPCLAMPAVTNGGDLAAVITVVKTPGARFSPLDLELLEELARRTALSIDNGRLYRDTESALRARDEFLAIAAHEIRGPITGIHLAVQSIQRERVPKESVPRLLGLLEREESRLSQFVNELLDLGRIRSGTFRLDYQQMDLTRVARDVVARLASEIARSGSAISVGGEQSVTGEWDQSRVDQVLTNLLSNALKFGLGHPIEVTVTQADGVAQLVVADHGSGMTRDVVERIFKPFERGVSVRNYGGLGLGLHIVKTIVDALGGSIAVESTPGSGSTFTVTLPRSRPARPQPIPAGVRPSPTLT